MLFKRGFFALFLVITFGADAAQEYPGYKLPVYQLLRTMTYAKRDLHSGQKSGDIQLVREAINKYDSAKQLAEKLDDKVAATAYIIESNYQSSNAYYYIFIKTKDDASCSKAVEEGKAALVLWNGLSEDEKGRIKKNYDHLSSHVRGISKHCEEKW